ncbi:hypothetical protein FOXB_06536 [Fusarium oxysporum f. sp. conglutinans Fo5176]|uniref:Uncharacterized protein n=1 Tax=Fusarium oxysporum (strain Fo5176) TaxID=660025 RepID=F9FJF7_FUSOF|nr:hypothetical protein FOXB_06536 [Fusarium oxysporum f. sp. conglutinans Fo5176]
MYDRRALIVCKSSAIGTAIARQTITNIWQTKHSGRLTERAKHQEKKGINRNTAPLEKVTEEAKNTPESTTTNKPTTEPVKKGSILNFFKLVPPSSTVTSSPKSYESQPGTTPPSSPPQPPKIELRKKPRLLRFRGTSTPLLDDENTGDDTQGEDTEAEDSGTKSARPTARENSLQRESSTSDIKPGKRGKAKTPTVQTTLNLSSQAAFSECKLCVSVIGSVDNERCALNLTTHNEKQGMGALHVEAARQMSVIGPISQALSQYPRDRSRSATPTNLTLFDVFRTLTAPSTASFIPSQFWTRELLQLAHSEPAVWHATLALGALHQRHELFWQGHGYHSGEKLWSQANENYGRAITCARDVKDPTQLLALSLALLSVTNMMGRWSESQVHIMAGHRLLSQAGHGSETSGAAEILTRLDLMAMTFSDSSAPYPYKLAPRTVWIDEYMKTAEIESYGQAGTALFGMMRRLMMLSETTVAGDEEGAAKDLAMLHLTMKDLSSWEYKMAQFEKKHPNPHDETGAVSIRLYHTMLRMFLSGGAFGPETRWDRFLGHYERILTLAETLWSNTPPSQVQSPPLPRIRLHRSRLHGRPALSPSLAPTPRN